MRYTCPICKAPLMTEDENFYTCGNCDEIFVIDDLLEEYNLGDTCGCGNQNASNNGCGCK